VEVAEATGIWGVSPGTVRTRVADGKFPMHGNPVKGYRLFKRDDLKNFLKSVARPVSTTNRRIPDKAT
jgi:hypothetical protein